MMYKSLRRKKNYIFVIMQIFSGIYLRYVFINDYSHGKRNKNLEYRDDLCRRMAWQYDSKKFQQESDVICIPFAVPYIFQRDRASAGEPQPDACGHEQSNHKREVSSSRKKNTNRTLSSILRNFFTPFPNLWKFTIRISCTIFYILNLIINLLIIRDDYCLILKFNKDILNFSSKRFNFEVESSSINFEFLFSSLFSRSNVRFTSDLWNSNSYCCVI